MTTKELLSRILRISCVSGQVRTTYLCRNCVKTYVCNNTMAYDRFKDDVISDKVVKYDYTFKQALLALMGIKK